MVGLCKGGNELPDSLKATDAQRYDALVEYAETNRPRHYCAGTCRINMTQLPSALEKKNTRFPYTSYNGWGDNRANHKIPPFWLDDRLPLLWHVGMRPAAGWSV
ncbi:hypothetical protein ANN_27450 [Periplaneta americana]|uniref:Uncharacterized protein n=1 Tax=Periplaneta americana TaxID=6978 RepID=A0ABQ8RVY1_PERAM|nr:hypothetical protein ANN_27450 [Periplaneta americana]